MFNAPFNLIPHLADITVTPDYSGLPPTLYSGLVKLTDNAAAVMFTVAGLGIVLSVGGLVVGYAFHRQHLSERAWSSLAVSGGAGALLYLGVHMANYVTGLFR